MTAMAIDNKKASNRVSTGLRMEMWGTRTLFQRNLRMNALMIMINNVMASWVRASERFLVAKTSLNIYFKLIFYFDKVNVEASVYPADKWI